MRVVWIIGLSQILLVEYESMDDARIAFEPLLGTQENPLSLSEIRNLETSLAAGILKQGGRTLQPLVEMRKDVSFEGFLSISVLIGSEPMFFVANNTKTGSTGPSAFCSAREFWNLCSTMSSVRTLEDHVRVLQDLLARRDALEEEKNASEVQGADEGLGKMAL